MSILFLITSIAFFVWIIRNVLFWVALWQVKEYRLDRMLVHLRETEQGRNLIFSPLLLCKLIAIFSYVVVVFSNNVLIIPYEIFVAGIFFYEMGVVIKEVLTRTLRRPVITGKSLTIVVLTIIFVAAFYQLPLLIANHFIWLLIVDKIVFLCIAFLVFLFVFPTEMYRDYVIEKASKKMASLPDVLVIGVTGSYGKSSTKEYIAQVLEKKFTVVKTKGTNNTPIGIANAVFSQVNDSTHIFVAEMGAYKRGEIKQLCDIVHPKIGVLTAVSHQHVSLFGGIKNTMKAKYELIESLPKDGLAIFNGNNENAYALYQQTKKKKALYQLRLNNRVALKKTNEGIIADRIVVRKKGITFNVVKNNKRVMYKTSLLGIHTIENILPAIYIAQHLGMKDADIQKAVAKLHPVDKTMTIEQDVSGATFINDTFNASPDSVFAALNYMKLYTKKRILILHPIIELGANAHTEHYRIGNTASHLCDYIFLTNMNYYKDVVKGVRDGGGKCLVEVASVSEIAQFIRTNVQKNDIVLFEGKEAGNALQKLTTV